jgi:hypothetical protein
MKAIPTRYNGLQFRSRLEAKWAAFFDEINWPYEDFVMTEFYRPLLVEVKPVIRWQQFKEHFERLNSCGWEGDILIAGTHIFHPPHTYPLIKDCQYSLLGAFYDALFNRWDFGLIFDCRGDHRSMGVGDLGITSANAGSVCRICSEFERGVIPGCNDRIPVDDKCWFVSKDAWKRACNKTQWNFFKEV